MPPKKTVKKTPKKVPKENKPQLPEWFQGLPYDVYKRILEISPEGRAIVQQLENEAKH
jgi:hypothetical protein